MMLPHFTKSDAAIVTGGLTQTSKMPCKSYSLPTLACRTGYRMRTIPGSICSECYAEKGLYKVYEASILPAQMARLESLSDPLWVDAMVVLIGNDEFFRWHDSGDLQNIEHLELIAQVCKRTPFCKHWLPTREYGIVAAFCAQYDIPSNLVIRLSAMFPDRATQVPARLRGIPGISVSNVHDVAPAIGEACIAPNQGGSCKDCRKCWERGNVVSYRKH